MHPTAPQNIDTPGANPALQPLLLALACLAICGPAWLAINLSPSATFFNQALALIGWGGFLALAASCQQVVRASDGAAHKLSATRLAVIVPALLAFAVMASFLLERLPGALTLSSLGLLAAMALTLRVAAAAAGDGFARRAFRAMCVAMVLAGIVSVALALVQVFAPGWADGEWVARSSTPGRAGGNLRQPNHLSSLLLWAMASLVWLHETLAERQPSVRLKQFRVITVVLMAALIFGDVLTVSRTGTICIVLLALWGVFDKSLSRFCRVLLWLMPLFYALCWVGMSDWSHSSAQVFAGGAQLHKSDLSSSRFGIWSNTLSLIAHNPWFGVGWGEFNFAWSLTPFPGRPGAFFDHTHNLPLQFLVELGIPLGTLVLLLLGWLLWKAFAAARDASPAESPMVRTAFVMVLMMVVHSMLEYPLWYAYFLLPTAFALGICLGQGVSTNTPNAAPTKPWFRRALAGASLALMLGTVVSVVDYMRVAAIFSSGEDAMPLSYRIQEGQKSWFFAHHADYAAATVAEHPSSALKAFRRAPHYLLDTRLMMAWAKAFAERGDVERARYIAERLREFRNPDSAEFFAECDAPRETGQPLPFQCTPSTRSFTYEDFKMR